MKIITLLLLLLSVTTMASDLTKTKEINYRGGLVKFVVPSDWVEEYDEENGGGTFYEDLPTSGTFRIYVLTMKSPNPVKKSDVANVLESVASPNMEVKKLPNGNAYKFYLQRSTDSGEDITIYYWSVAQIVEPYHARIANFSYTILSNQENSEHIKSELRFLNSTIENATFYPKIENGI